MANTPFGPVDSDVSPALLPLAAQQSVEVSNSVTGISGWTTGDYKVSAQAADHADAGGGSWLICDGTAVGATNAALVALIGATRPDGRGRTLVMQGTNADVSTLLANDGQAVANRRPKHRTSNNLSLTKSGSFAPAIAGSGAQVSSSTGPNSAEPGYTIAGSIGTNNANDALDTPSFLVPGNLFIHT